MHETKHLLVPGNFPALRRKSTSILQVNLGYMCNQSCVHCHVNAGPNRTEMMSDDLIDLLIEFIKNKQCSILDLTGGAPEMHPRFRQLVTAADDAGIAVRDRCNLTILYEPGQQQLAGFLAEHQVEIVASMPCYEEKNVDLQRGKDVFSRSIRALKELNRLGYAKDPALALNLVYNPLGPVLPPDQEVLKRDFKKQLLNQHGIVFNDLFAIANMPIQRFGSSLISTGHFDSYLDTLRSSHQENNLEHVMCRDTVSIDWQGYVYDCDFNQMLDMPLVSDKEQRLHIKDLFSHTLDGSVIQTGDHCYGCTAGQGSSCSGALN